MIFKWKFGDYDFCFDTGYILLNSWQIIVWKSNKNIYSMTQYYILWVSLKFYEYFYDLSDIMAFITCQNVFLFLWPVDFYDRFYDLSNYFRTCQILWPVKIYDYDLRHPDTVILYWQTNLETSWSTWIAYNY